MLELWRALRNAHEGAVFLHCGQRYQVVRLDLEASQADAVPVGGRDHTEALVARDYELREPSESRRLGEWEVHLRRVRISQQVVAFKRHHRDEVVATVPLSLPSVDLDTWAVTATVDRLDLGRVLAVGRDPAGALHAAEHGLIHAMPLLAMCDRGDAGGLSTVLDSSTGSPLILLYDGHQGGAGIADLAYACFDNLVELTIGMTESCDCPMGCPRCVYDRSCGNGNEPMDRLGAVEVLRSLRRSA